MKIKYFLEKSHNDTCVALGFFDGVHLGHQVVLKNTVEKARDTQTIPTVFTFSQNPKAITKNISIPNITTLEKKETLLRSLGIELLYCIDFAKVINLSPIEFIQNILVNTLKAKYVFCGFNFKFGQNASADANNLTELCKNYGIEVYIISPIKFQGTIVSSSQIRELISLGNHSKANTLLGYQL